MMVSAFSLVPSIATVSPTSGAVGKSVTAMGPNFGSTQGTSTVTFNGTRRHRRAGVGQNRSFLDSDPGGLLCPILWPTPGLAQAS
jgi:hypothetical protein